MCQDKVATLLAVAFTQEISTNTQQRQPLQVLVPTDDRHLTETQAVKLLDKLDP